jgi:hypothetical protein
MWQQQLRLEPTFDDLIELASNSRISMASSGIPRSRFFLVEDTEVRDAFFAEPSRGAKDGVRRFSRSRALGGKVLYDWIFTGLVANQLISKRVSDALVEANVTGWDAEPMVLMDGRKEVPNYALLVIVGRSGPLDHSKCPIEVEIFPATGRQVHMQHGLFFDPESWDGSNLFVPDGSSFLIADAQAKSLIESLGIPTVTFRDIADFRHLRSSSKR